MKFRWIKLILGSFQRNRSWVWSKLLQDLTVKVLTSITSSCRRIPKFSIICQFFEISPSSRKLKNLRKVDHVLVDLQGSRKYYKFSKIFQVCETMTKISKNFTFAKKNCPIYFFDKIMFAKKNVQCFRKCQLCEKGGPQFSKMSNDCENIKYFSKKLAEDFLKIWNWMAI